MFGFLHSSSAVVRISFFVLVNRVGLCPTLKCCLCVGQGRLFCKVSFCVSALCALQMCLTCCVGLIIIVQPSFYYAPKGIRRIFGKQVSNIFFDMATPQIKKLFFIFFFVSQRSVYNSCRCCIRMFFCFANAHNVHHFPSSCF